ncbi:hypothetical protein ACFQYP_38215 [Nonomuraea antimicrobica]
MILGYVLSGLVTGAIFAIMGSGLTLSYAATGVFNFAHGAIGFLTALLFYQLNQAGVPAWLSALVAVALFAPALGYALHKAMFRGLAQAGRPRRSWRRSGSRSRCPPSACWSWT